MLLWLAYILYDIVAKEDRLPHVNVGAETLRLSSPSNPSRVSCFASITNEDKLIWSDPSLQAQFFDRAGHPVDVHYETYRLHLLPQQSMQGRVSGALNTQADDYATCKITVLYAK